MIKIEEPKNNTCNGCPAHGAEIAIRFEFRPGDAICIRLCPKCRRELRRLLTEYERGGSGCTCAQSNIGDPRGGPCPLHHGKRE